MRNAGKIVSSVFLAQLFFVMPSFAHCEIPCGIYGDETRVKLIEEHIGTIEKSIKTIKSLGSEKIVNYNQLVRWVDNKEEHAEKIQEIVYQYFLTQRIKLVDSKDKTNYDLYTNKIAILHEMLVYAMKTKQSLDLENVNKLKEAVARFRDVYFVKKGKE